MIERIAGDIETNSSGEIICVCVWDSKQGYDFKNLQQFFHYIIKEKVKSCYFHYGGGFDFNFIMQYIRDETNFVITNFLEVGGLIYTLTIDFQIPNWGRFELIDSFPLFRTGLDNVAENLLGVGKSHKELDKGHLEDYERKIVVDYCINDCKILYDCLVTFENEIQMPLELSAPMQALKFFKTNYMDKNYELWKDIKPFNLRTLGILRSWYFGGHVDVYRTYGENLYEYDIVNCYGSAMKEYGAPIGYPIWISERQKSPYTGLYIVKVLDKSLHPHLCKRIEQKGSASKLFFLNSDQEFYCTEIDLQFMDVFEIHYKIEAGLRFYHAKDFFTDYVDFWFTKRFHSKKLKFISKLMINSLYGKFGQNPNRVGAQLIPNSENFNGIWYDEKLRIGRKEKIIKNWYNQTQIAAWITSGARCNLHYYMYRFIENGANIYYCDTDSLFIDKNLHKDVSLKHLFTNTKELGKMELESEIKRGYFVGNKFRAQVNLDDSFEFRSKGFYNANFTEDHFKSALTGSHIFSSEQSFVRKFKSALKTTGDFVAYGQILKTVKQFELKRKKINDVETRPYNQTKNGKLI